MGRGNGKFPGEKSPGLIEASHSATRRRWHQMRFRGRNPPASLKLCSSSTDSRLPSSFRGRNPPASLKHDRAWADMTLAAEVFPGEKSPGLIEAGLVGGHGAPQRLDVSGGEIPRPH